jgi:HEPN domain-containing protein
MLWMPSEEYEKEDAEESLKKAELVLNAARDFYKYWFLREEE